MSPRDTDNCGKVTKKDNAGQLADKMQFEWTKRFELSDRSRPGFLHKLFTYALCVIHMGWTESGSYSEIKVSPLVDDKRQELN